MEDESVRANVSENGVESDCDCEIQNALVNLIGVVVVKAS